MTVKLSEIEKAAEGGNGWLAADFEIIVVSRTAIPAMTAALRDVLALLDDHEQANPEGREQWNADIRAAITAHVDPT